MPWANTRVVFAMISRVAPTNAGSVICVLRALVWFTSFEQADAIGIDRCVITVHGEFKEIVICIVYIVNAVI